MLISLGRCKSGGTDLNCFRIKCNFIICLLHFKTSSMVVRLSIKFLLTVAFLFTLVDFRILKIFINLTLNAFPSLFLYLL